MLEGGQKISLKPNTTNFGAVTSGFVEVTSIDGNSTKTDKGTFTVKIITDPLAPQLAGSDLIVSERLAESSGFSFPIDIPINATRTSFEKVGLRISANDKVTGGYFLVKSNKSYLYVNMVRTGNDTQAQRSILREELTQSLGLYNDSWKYPNSIFYQGGNDVTEYSDLDKEIIQMLYN